MMNRVLKGKIKIVSFSMCTLKYIYLFYILSTFFLTFSPPRPSPPLSFSPHLLLLHFYLEKRTGLPWISTKHSIASCSKTKHIALY